MNHFPSPPPLKEQVSFQVSPRFKSNPHWLGHGYDFYIQYSMGGCGQERLYRSLWNNYLG